MKWEEVAQVLRELRKEGKVVILNQYEIREYRDLKIEREINRVMLMFLHWFMDNIKPIGFLLRLGMGYWGKINYERFKERWDGIEGKKEAVNKAIKNNVLEFCGSCEIYARLILGFDGKTFRPEWRGVGENHYNCLCCGKRVSSSSTFYDFREPPKLEEGRLSRMVLEKERIEDG